MKPSEVPHPARVTYDALAPHYDDLTQDLDYEPWLAEALPQLESRGLGGNRLLDVGCGTGRSMIPMLERGWDCSGCDISPAMLEIARERTGEAVRLEVADMCHLPRIGEFDLVWSLNDSVNYLLDLRQLELALRSMRRNMAATGLLVFDLNTLLTYRTFFAERRVVGDGDRRLVWEGQASADHIPGSIAKARVEAQGYARSGHIHRQRHFTEAEVMDALSRADLECLCVRGQTEAGELQLPLEELVHVKALYIARKRGPQMDQVF